MQAWIGLGGNQEASGDLLAAALAQLEASPGIRVRRQSRIYRSPPWGRTDQPDFLNAVAELETSLRPLPLLRRMLEIENRLGRKRDGSRWGPRCIDLDLLSYEEVTVQSTELVLPHPQMHLRAFVLVPLLELEPGFLIPGVGPAADCLRNLDASETTAVEPLPSSSEEYSS